MSFFAPNYSLILYRRSPYGAGIGNAYRLHTLAQGSFSLVTGSGVGQAQIQLTDVDGSVKKSVNPQPMDIVVMSSNSRWTNALTVIWTGYVDIATVHFDAEQGRQLVLNCSSPYKLWEITTLSLGNTVATQQINDPAALAIASFRGIAAQDLVQITAKRVGYPGPMASLPQSPNLYFGPTTAFGGLWNYTLPDNVFTMPDLSTYSAVVQGMVADTGNELFFDEGGNCIFRSIGYLDETHLPIPGFYIPRRINSEDIMTLDLGVTDQDVVSEVRVRYSYQGSFIQDGYWTAPAGLVAQLGPRVRVINAPWIRNQEAAMFLAKAIGQMYSAHIGVGTVTIPADPAFRVGTVCRVPTLDPGNNYGYYYISGIVYTLTWGDAWVMTLQLEYGRSPTQQFPYTLQGQSIPVLSGAGLDGVPKGNGNLDYSTGSLRAAYPIQLDSSLSGDFITLDLNLAGVGSVVKLQDSQGHSLGPSLNGEYTVSADSTPGQLFIGATFNSTQQGVVTVVVYKSLPANTGSGTTNTAVGTGTGPVYSPQTNPPTGADGDSHTSPATADNTPLPGGWVWPVAGTSTRDISQVFGNTGYAAEPSYTYTGPVPTNANYNDQYYDHFHTGLDIQAASGTNIYFPAPPGFIGTVIFAGWNTQGFGNMTQIKCGDFIFLFGHQSEFKCSVNDTILSGQLIGTVDSTGNSSGPHLHFGIKDTRVTTAPNTDGVYVDPMLYLIGATAS